MLKHRRACQRKAAPNRLMLSDPPNLAALDPVRQRYGLRARLRALALHPRARMCGAWVVDSEGARIACTGQPGQWRAAWVGVLRCGKIWTCPVCSATLRSKRAERATDAMNELGGRWQMVTHTIRHRPGDKLGVMMRGLMKAVARMRRTRAMGAIWARAVSASVRGTEVTWGLETGWHPHLHVLFRLETLTPDEQATWRAAWRRAVVKELGRGHEPTLSVGVVFSEPVFPDREDPTRAARYVMKLGLEIAGVAKDARKDGRLNTWQLAERATKRHDAPEEWRAWSEFQEATHGRRMLELDDRASKAAERFKAKHEPEPVEGKTVDVKVSQDELTALRRSERSNPAAFGIVLNAMRQAQDPEAAFWDAFDTLTPRSLTGPPVGAVLGQWPDDAHRPL